MVGLQSKTSTVKNGPEGLITIWNPTEMQVKRLTIILLAL